MVVACRVTDWTRLGDGGLEGLVAERAQEVVAAFEELAGDRDARAVGADPCGELFVLRALWAAGAPGGLCCFIERPAQRGRALPERCPGARLLSEACTVMSTDVSYRAGAQRVFGFVGGHASVSSAARAAA